ncbi:MAG TPA: nuclear transport factor 2 family protein [Blastocatellia bacterium]|nr:nuclear transport factor 2 family protein [Blastocatellia bacterium]
MSDAKNQTEHEIRKLAHEWLDAARRRDREPLDRILADDFLISGWQPDGRLADKRYYIEDCLRPVEIQEGAYRFDRWQVRQYGETAVVNCILDIHAIVDGAKWGGEALITDVWVREGEVWRVVTRHSSPIVRSKNDPGEAEVS